jgi:hypothetical protein
VSSSVSIVSGYGLDDRAIEVWSPAEAKDFSSNICVQTASEVVHIASCAMGTGSTSQGVKNGGGVTLSVHPHLVPKSWMSRSYHHLPLCVHRCVVGLLYLFTHSLLFWVFKYIPSLSLQFILHSVLVSTPFTDHISIRWVLLQHHVFSPSMPFPIGTCPLKKKFCAQSILIFLYVSQ